jgi:sulfatase maturation enzyme AslB (radical SAM superfamily)
MSRAGTFRRRRRGAAIRSIDHLKKHGVDFNTLTVVHHRNSCHPLEVYRFPKQNVQLIAKSNNFSLQPFSSLKAAPDGDISGHECNEALDRKSANAAGQAL